MMVRRTPPVAPGAGERVPLQCRSTVETRDLLKAAAERSSRSVSQEMEMRLEQSFAADQTRTIIREELARAEAEKRDAQERRNFGPHSSMIGVGVGRIPSRAEWFK